MESNFPDILALDFDGVLCDGAIEYFQSSWRAYCQIWASQPHPASAELETSFYKLRPVIETGWEMPLLLRALILGISEAEILSDWQPMAARLLASERVEAVTLGQTLDSVRDEWIAYDLAGWLGLHRFYPGVGEKVRQILAQRQPEVFVITTKEGRFTKNLLQQQGIDLPQLQIIGKENKQPKHQTLRRILGDRNSASIWFVEDRLKTLQSIQQQPDLGTIRLYLADWGYNTEAERQSAERDAAIELLSLGRFVGDLSHWNSIAPQNAASQEKARNGVQ